MKLPNDKVLILDIETDGLLLEVNNMWVGAIYDVNAKELHIFKDINKLVDFIISSDFILVGHNLSYYDINVLEKLTHRKINNKLFDTMLFSNLHYYDKDMSHSLESWGLRLGMHKKNHNDFSKYSDELKEYCIQDVRITFKLFKYFQSIKDDWLQYEALDIEQKTNKIIGKQYLNGWTFDIKEAQKLHVNIIRRIENDENVLKEYFKPLLYGNKHKFMTEFNPENSNHIIYWITELYGEQDWELTEKGNKKTDEESLRLMFNDKPWIDNLISYIENKRLLTQLVDSDKSWMNNIKNNKLHCNINILGTNTGRATHKNPNLAQVNKNKEVRRLFKSERNTVLVGSDLQAIELRILSHLLYRYDNGTYANTIDNEDIHNANMEFIGLKTREEAKTFIYAFLYGAGNKRLGRMLGGDETLGASLREQLMENLPGLKELLEQVRKVTDNASYDTSRRYFKVFGRRIQIRSSHSALNALIQSIGAYVSKQWLIEIDKLIEERNIVCNQIGWVHDEVIFECLNMDSKELSKILEEAAIKAGEALSLNCSIKATSKIGKSWDEIH